MAGGCKKKNPNPGPRTFDVIVSWSDTIHKAKATHCDGDGDHTWQPIDDKNHNVMRYPSASDTLVYKEDNKCFFWAGGKYSTSLTTSPSYTVKINGKVVYNGGPQGFGITLTKSWLDNYISANGL